MLMTGHLNKIDGLSLIRGEEIPDGVFHLCCEIIVKHADGTYIYNGQSERENKNPSRRVHFLLQKNTGKD